MKLFTRFLFALEDGGAGGAAAPAWHEGIITKGADGTESLTDFASWKDKAPAPLRDFITGNMTAARAKTDGMVRLPTDRSTPEEVAAYHRSIGVPDDLNQYDYALPEGLTEANIDKAQIDAWRKEFKEAGIPKAAASRIINKHLSDTVAAANAKSTEFKAQIAAEKITLGKRFPQIDQTVAQASELLNRAGVPESLKAAIKAGAFDPSNEGMFWGADALEAFAWAAKASGEDRGAGGAGAAQGMTIAVAKEIMSDAKHPMHDKYKAGDKDLAAKIAAAYKAGI